MDIKRKFGEDTYTLFSHHPTKRKAKEYARKLREKGFCARVVKVEYTLGVPWSVFKRKRKRKK